MVQYILELLQFLRLLFQLINLALIGINGFVSLLDHRLLRLDILLQLLVRLLQSLYLVLVLALLLYVTLLLLLLFGDLLLGDGHIALGPK